ncbi:MAG: hypothetical protein IK094_00355 [Treponema sp.]|nr:hypothetical protein [Treponema sp.]
MKIPARPIILCGIKHCGKSTQAKLIASAIGAAVYDTDDLIYDQTGMDARTIYKRQGKDAFMQEELKACEFLRASLQGNESQAVIATGGGICQNDSAMQILKALGSIVYLEIDEKSAADRIMREARFLPDGKIENLPAYIAAKNPNDETQARAIFHDFYLERTQKYKSLADVAVNMQGSREKNCNKILAALGL